MNTIKTKQQPIVWTISGSDCSGGAGIAADIKTGHALGVEVCHLITANTVQNSLELVSVNPVSVEILQAQWQALVKDKPPKVIKIGLLVNAAQVNWLSQAVSQLKQLSPALICVYDPVGQASVGGALSSLTSQQLAPLLTFIDVITPNLAEANVLAQLTNETNVVKLAKKIQQDFAISSVIIKGGHSTDSAFSTDYCLHQLAKTEKNQVSPIMRYQLRSTRIASNYSHGGGCCFASAIASFLAHNFLLRDAFTLAKAFINQGLSATSQQSSVEQHQYYGAFAAHSWPREYADFPEIIPQNNTHNKTLGGFSSLELGQKKLGLYPVVDSLNWLERLLPLGLNIIQLRIKDLNGVALENLIINAIELAKCYQTRLFINDHWQLAIKHGAYGVHIGQEDLATADLLQIQQAGLRLGISTHGCYEFLLAQQLQPSYLAIGAIFATKTKDMSGQIQGIDNLKRLINLRPKHKAQQIPIVAIGGINLERAPQVLATTVDSIAVVTAITEAEHPEEVVRKLKAMIS